MPCLWHTIRLIESGAIPLDAVRYVSNRYCPPGFSQTVIEKYDQTGLISLEIEGNNLK